MADLKLGKLPDRTPVKLTITITPDLQAALQAYGEEMLYRHIFRTTKARKRFLAWLDRDGSLSRMHELVALAFQRGTTALGEALDEIADRSGTSKSSGEQPRQSRSLLAG